jgi:pimeloyl-ACP methyl ester carboxylesterase
MATRPDGTRISVQTYPTVGSRLPVLLVHGLGSDAETNWLRAGWVRALRKAGRTLISLDLRGHGHSDSPHDPDRYRLGVMVGDLRAALDEVLEKEGPIDAIGYSLGARLLLEFAQHDLYEIRRLVVGGTAGQPLLQSIVPDDIERAVHGGATPVAAESARVTSVITALPTSDPLALVALVRGLNADSDTARRAPDPSMPTLVGVGSSDPLHDGAAAWVADLSGAEFVSLPGRTHFSAVPSSVFRAAAVEFLNR